MLLGELSLKLHNLSTLKSKKERGKVDDVSILSNILMFSRNTGKKLCNLTFHEAGRLIVVKGGK